MTLELGTTAVMSSDASGHLLEHNMMVLGVVVQ